MVQQVLNMAESEKPRLTSVGSLNNAGKNLLGPYRGTEVYLFVAKKRTRRWLFKYSRSGKAREYQGMLAKGLDLWTENRAGKLDQAKQQTFNQFAAALIAEQAKGFRNAKHIAQSKMPMKVDAKCLQRLLIDKIEVTDVLAVLWRICTAKLVTAKRIQGRIERILDSAPPFGLCLGVKSI